MRVAHLNMTDTNQHCPSGFKLITSPKEDMGVDVSTTFPLNGVKYSRVCGKIIGYQHYIMLLTHLIHTILIIATQLTVSMLMVLASLMVKHIWTLAAAHDEIRSNQWVCPCTKTDTPFTGVVPPFIGQDVSAKPEVLIKSETSSIMQILFEMAQAVVPPVAAVALTTHPGSVNNYHNLPLMTLR